MSRRSQQSSHGRWTLSSSDEESEAQALSGTPSVRRDAMVSTPQVPCSEARSESYKRKANPVKFKEPTSMEPANKQRSDQEGAEPSPAKKQRSDQRGAEPSLAKKQRSDQEGAEPSPAKKQRSDQRGAEPSPVNKQRSDQKGAEPSPAQGGWSLSSSDEESEPRKASSSQKAADKSRDAAPTTNEKTPSDSQDPWDLLQAGEPFRFYLTKVTGIKDKYNSGALHIKDILSPLFGTLTSSVQ
ncbi:tyrosyl-DNA phosphodiesterase 1, partial [Mantella aurantiaca]